MHSWKNTKKKSDTLNNAEESTSDAEQPPYLEVPRPPALSWIYDDIYNCFKVVKKTLIVRLNDNHKLYRKYEQYDDEKEDYFRCMSCSQANSENDDEEYIYQSRAHRDDGLVHSEPHTETCQPFSFETHDIQTRLSTSISEDIEWYYHNSFTKFELFEANNNNDAPERVKVYQQEDSYWMFIKSESNEFKCENCLKLGWSTCAKFVDEKVMTQSHHPICFIIEVPK
jgi:hypothetical protein